MNIRFSAHASCRTANDDCDDSEMTYRIDCYFPSHLGVCVCVWMLCQSTAGGHSLGRKFISWLSRTEHTIYKWKTIKIVQICYRKLYVLCIYWDHVHMKNIVQLNLLSFWMSQCLLMIGWLILHLATKNVYFTRILCSIQCKWNQFEAVRWHRCEKNDTKREK